MRGQGRILAFAAQPSHCGLDDAVVVEGQAGQLGHGQQDMVAAGVLQQSRRNHGVVSDGYRPASRVTPRAGKRGQLLQIGADNAGFVSQHTHGSIVCALVSLCMHIPPRQREHALEGLAVTAQQQDLQRVVAQGQQDDIDGADDGGGFERGHAALEQKCNLGKLNVIFIIIGQTVN